MNWEPVHFVQAHNPDWVLQPLFVRYHPNAIWFDDPQPTFGEQRFFFERDRSLEEP
jgi:hypothetical protein